MYVYQEVNYIYFFYVLFVGFKRQMCLGKPLPKIFMYYEPSFDVEF